MAADRAIWDGKGGALAEAKARAKAAKKIEPSGIPLPRLALPSVPMPSMALPAIEVDGMPLSLPSLTLPSINLPQVDVTVDGKPVDVPVIQLDGKPIVGAVEGIAEFVDGGDAGRSAWPLLLAAAATPIATYFATQFSKIKAPSNPFGPTKKVDPAKDVVKRAMERQRENMLKEDVAREKNKKE